MDPDSPYSKYFSGSGQITRIRIWPLIFTEIGEKLIKKGLKKVKKNCAFRYDLFLIFKCLSFIEGLPKSPPSLWIRFYLSRLPTMLYLSCYCWCAQPVLLRWQVGVRDGAAQGLRGASHQVSYCPLFYSLPLHYYLCKKCYFAAAGKICSSGSSYSSIRSKQLLAKINIVKKLLTMLRFIL